MEQGFQQRTLVCDTIEALSHPGISDTDSDDDFASFTKKKEHAEYMKEVVKLESIYCLLGSMPTFSSNGTEVKSKRKHAPWVLAMRVVTPLLHPISQELITMVTSSNCSLNSADEKRTKSVGAPTSVDTLSLLANLPAHMGHSFQLTLDKAAKGQHIERRRTPRILFTCTNAVDELYETELSFEDLLKSKYQMEIDNLSWENYLKQMHKAIFSYSCREDNNNNIILSSEQPNNYDDRDMVHVQYEDESCDLLKLSLFSTCSIDNCSNNLRLKYEFELCAVRDPSQFDEKLQALVIDQTIYSTNLYRKRMLEDIVYIKNLEADLANVKRKLAVSEDKLTLFQSNYQLNVAIGSMVVGDDNIISIGNSDSSKENNGSSLVNGNKQNKRKPPKNLLNPGYKKRKTIVEGVKIK
jgi:hypothetical protein